MNHLDAVELSLFAQRVNAICEEMGAQLKHSAFSPNIRDRLDYSCAVFDAAGGLTAQAAHIPVHLGSMAYAMKYIVSAFEWFPGDQVILNDPYLGGTHLPDVTLVAPVFVDAVLCGFVANRAHYADIGSVSPGSMPLTTSLEDEGMLLSPQKLVDKGELNQSLIDAIADQTRSRQDALGDINAQVGCNRRGIDRLQALLQKMTPARYQQAVAALNDYAETLAYGMISRLKKGTYAAQDVMEDDGQGLRDIPIKLTLTIDQAGVRADFSGTADQVAGNINCPFSVTVAAVWYVLRCLMPAGTPACAGCFRPISIDAPEGSLVNARYPAAVAAGNVETSSRIVDVVLLALSRAASELIPALSQGTMNNIAFGASEAGEQWGYYETIGGGMGASYGNHGLDAVQSHMTNTRNTPIEVLEMRYPLRISRYGIRRESGGRGRNRGGDGLIREFEFTRPGVCTLLTERRRHTVPGLNGGGCGAAGVNRLNQQELPGKCTFSLQVGDKVSMETPGGGAWGGEN